MRSFSLLLLLLGWASLHAADPPAKKPEAKKPPAKKLFDGKTLNGWRVLNKQDFEDHGKVAVQQGEIVLPSGSPATGIAWKGEFPRTNYEILLEARRRQGSDFFCGLTFPVDKSYCTLIVGGWGGGVVGLSNVDNFSASENDTTSYLDFAKNKWSKIRIRVSKDKVQAWVDKEQIADLKKSEHKFSIWWEQEPARPFGVATWNTEGGLRNIQLKTW